VNPRTIKTSLAEGIRDDGEHAKAALTLGHSSTSTPIDRRSSLAQSMRGDTA
jgi:hypothetical protein